VGDSVSDFAPSSKTPEASFFAKASADESAFERRNHNNVAAIREPRRGDCN